MEQYIPKAALVAEIKGLIRANELYLSEPKTDEIRFQKAAAYSVLNDLLHFLDTLEVKEVDLDKEIDKEIETRWRGEYLFTSKFRESAKHFFELGLSTRKGVDLSLIEPHIKEEWNKINTGHTYSIIDSYNIFVGICTYFYKLGLGT